MRRALALPGIVVLSSGLLLAQALFNKPVEVFGDPNFIGTAASPLVFNSLGPNWVEGKELNAPTGIAIDNSVSPPIIYIADSGNNRVLGYRYATQLVAGSVADLVIGQLDFFSTLAQNPGNGGRQAGLNNPTGVAVDSKGNLYVADSGNNRVLCFPQPFNPANSNQFPSLVIGQKTLSTGTANLNGLSASSIGTNGSGLGRTGLSFDSSGNLWVADTGNNRVLRFPAPVLSAGANFPAADMVIGQTAFTTSTAATSITSLTALAGPNGVSLDSAGNLYVSDHGRVLFFAAPLITGEKATAILGVDPAANGGPTQTSLNTPAAVVAVPTGPIVADTLNNRLMVYNPEAQWASETTQFSPTANAVAGQTSFTQNQANQGNGDASASTLNNPVDVAATSQELYVVDSLNNRVLVFLLSPTGVSGAATRVIGQLDFPYFGNNLVDGKGFSFPGGYPAGAVLDTNSTPWHLYVPDTLNNRILGYNDFQHLQNGQTPDIVIGQPDFNRVVTNYPSGNANTPTASSLNLPTAAVVDSAGNLYVTDTGNSRVLRFPAPFSSGMTSLETADLVIGQSGFTSYITDATTVTMNSPVGLAFTADGANVSKTNSGWLAVTDASQNRVLFFQKPFASGMSATLVLGQSSFTASASSNQPAGFNSPRGVSIDPQDRIVVADTGNARVQIFDQVSNLHNGVPPLVTLGGFSAPTSTAFSAAGDFWVADPVGNRMVHYPALPNLALNNDASDAFLSVLAPHSGFVDPFNNLLVTDGINRILYFVPQIAYQNAANYSTRPLTAGTITAIYPSVPANPAVTPNVIAEGTAVAPANQFPLPTTLADTQVTVNGAPVPLYFVSPVQDNIILPQLLPSSGTANIQVVRRSTGQILGANEIQLASASPALFTQGAAGSGQLLAVNFQDSNVNSASDPVVRGQYMILYGTGVGPVANPPADGAAAAGQPAPDFPQVLIQSSSTGTGGTTTPLFIPATVTYSGLAPGYAGLWQINVQIPVNAKSGSAVVLRVYEKDIPNLDQSSALTTTIAVN